MNKYTVRLLCVVILVGIVVLGDGGTALALTQVTRRLVVYVRDVNSGAPVGAASVFLDNTLAGTTDSSGTVLIGKASDRQQMTVVKEGYRFLETANTLKGDMIAYVALDSRLHTDGRWIKDATGAVIRLKGDAIFWKFRYSSQYSGYNPLSYNDEINETSLDTLKNAGANFIRLTVNGWTWYVKKAPNYITAVDTVISWSRKRGIMVVLDNHAPWYDTDNSVVYKDQIALTIDPTDWKNFMVELAQRYKNDPTVIGFDMLNEPRPVSEWQAKGYSSQQAWSIWRSNVLNVVQAIHAVDPTYLCFVEPLGSSNSNDDMNYFKSNPLPEPNIVYGAHIYYAWDYPWFDYAKNYASGQFDLAKKQMETLYYERFLDMLDAGFPVINMESGIYRDPSTNPNWNKYMNDALSLYEKYGASVCWYPFDPDRQDSSLISLLSPDRINLTDVGLIWAAHMTSSI